MRFNPTRVTFTHPTEFTDGTPFGAEDYAGTEFAYGFAPWAEGSEYFPTVSVPVAFGDGTGELPIAALDLPENVELFLVARTVAANGQVSAWSAPSADTFKFDVRRPLAPSAVSVA